ncbi:C40 family peptidase [Inconstantimicrobium porci]|uniref:C40 family peptidase n=1 Tax=Inconstantimicrobium porci TaxID=2652291 RepID=UPI00240A1F24|nr:C40 family peptidase [Inconstantimicrobium porci]MDD6771724.1 NlpC/P60 family protein [Inconstantimicrobium porci]
MKKKTISILLAVTLLAGTSFTAYAEPLTDSQKQEIQQNKQKLEDVNSKINILTDKIDSLTGKIEPLVWKVQENEKKIENIKSEMVSLQKDIDVAKENLDKKQQAFGKRMRAIYKSGGNESYISILFSSISLSDLIDKVQAVGKVMKIDKQIIKDIENQKNLLDNKKKELQNKQDEINKINEENKIKIEKLNKLKAEQQVEVDKLKEEKKKITVNLADSEKPLIEYPISIIKNESSSISELRNAIEMLITARDQITTDEIDNQAKAYIEKAKDIISSRQQSSSSTAGSSSTGSSLNRGGNGNTYSGNTSSLLEYAYKFLGRPYVYGATGPSSFDCSGFTSYVYRNAAGINLPRTTWEQINVGKSVSYSELQPGDLVFTNDVKHVGIYVGGGQMIHAPRPGEVVKVGPIYHYKSSRRVIG